MHLSVHHGVGTSFGFASACEVLEGANDWVPYGTERVQIDARLYDVEKFLLVKPEEQREQLLKRVNELDPSRLRWVAQVDADRVTCGAPTTQGCVISIRGLLAERNRGMY